MSGALHSGTEIPGYRILEPLGRGGMGVVHLAEQVSLGRRVALKIIAPELAGDPSFRARFERESKIAASLDHPNVVPVFEAGEHEGTLYLAMRYVPGTDLRELLATEGFLAPQRAVQIVSQIATALDVAHRRGLVHRDVKPANILIAGEHAYLSDFGLTKHATSHGGLTATGQWVGTLDYVSPEQIEGRSVDARADVYSLGCVLFATLSGHVPFERDSDMAKLYAHVTQPPPRPSELNAALPVGLDDVVQRALAKDPAARYQSAGDMARAAAAACQGRGEPLLDGSVATGAAAPRAVSASNAGTHLDPQPVPRVAAWTPPGPVPMPGPAPKRRRAVPVALVVAALILAGGGIAAAVIASGGSSGSESPRSAAPAPPGGATTAPGPSAERGGPRYERFIAPTYVAELPLGWQQVQDYESQGGGSYYRTKVVKGDMTILIDTTPGSNGDPKQTAVDQEPAGSPGYRRLRWRYTQLGSDTAFDWVFEKDGQRREDILFYRGGDGYGVLGESSRAEYRKMLAVTRHVAGSVQSR